MGEKDPGTAGFRDESGGGAADGSFVVYSDKVEGERAREKEKEIRDHDRRESCVVVVRAATATIAVAARARDLVGR